MENRAILSLGSNIGNRTAYLYNAIKKLEANNLIQVSNFSSIFETDPVGFTEQDPYLNMAIEIVTDYTPFDLLQVCLSIEKELGRERVIRWGPRTLDLDILLFNQEIINEEQLQIPHPRMAERAFVLIPVNEISPVLIVPGINKSISDLVETIPKEGVRLWKQKFGDDVYVLFGN